MGVHGLATYLRENQRKLSTPLVLSQERSKSEVTIPLVVDGWSCVPPVGFLPNVTENGPAVLYMNFTISLACRGRMAVNRTSSATW
jgi:hypothetical protein